MNDITPQLPLFTTAPRDEAIEIPYGYCHCGCGEKTTIPQYNRASTGYVKGVPLRYVRGHMFRTLKGDTPEERFWNRVDMRGPNECWEWQGPISKNGYGLDRDRLHFHEFHMHRVAYIYSHGPIPDGLHCLHECDHRPCCNPAHLFLGTNDDNIADKVAKQRQPRGKTHGIAKLTEEQVVEIRKRYAQGGVLMRELGEHYGVCRGTISSVIRRENWEWLK